MTNARDELLNFLAGKPPVICLSFARDCNYSPGPETTGTLDEVLPHLDFDYCSGFGSQELFGTIWFADGSWADRGEYDGSEWWQHQSRPDLPARFA